jgi:hypothetical protein
MEILSQFLLRLAFGLAVGMGVLPSKQVTGGFFRNHLYVTLGLSTLAALVLAKIGSDGTALAVAAAVLSFCGAASWLYEARLPGKVMIWLVAFVGYAAAVVAAADAHPMGTRIDREVAIATSGLVLGLVFTAMLLGHWYLNAPGMSLEPLQNLLVYAAVVVIVQGLISADGIRSVLSNQEELSSSWFLFVGLRWSFGILAVLALLWMAWRTLKIPNTQSATGILYVAVICVFAGELTAALLSSESMFPL